VRFPSALHRATLVRRYKRFLADVVFEDGREETVHVPNPGAMIGLSTPGMTAWVSRGGSKTRKLAHTLELVEADGGLVGINTLHPNRIVAEALADGAIPEVAGYASVRREVKYGAASRVDFLLEQPGRPRCWLEIKNVHLMREPGLAEFPDCVAARSLKHLRELSACVVAGERAVMLFVVQRGDCGRFAAAVDFDPAYAKGLLDAYRAGVEVLCYDCTIDLASVRLRRAVPWRDRPKTGRRNSPKRRP
jgi:sugar fermentation stimulation protein A